MSLYSLNKPMAVLACVLLLSGCEDLQGAAYSLGQGAGDIGGHIAGGIDDFFSGSAPAAQPNEQQRTPPAVTTAAGGNVELFSVNAPPAPEAMPGYSLAPPSASDTEGAPATQDSSVTVYPFYGPPGTTPPMMPPSSSEPYPSPFDSQPLPPPQ